jgi:hypothetical protein
MRYSSIRSPIVTSSNCVFLSEFCQHDTSDITQIAITHGGIGSSAIRHCYVFSGTASAISISTQLLAQGCVINSGNANIVVGTGTFIYTAIHLSNAADGNFSVSNQTVRSLGQSVNVGTTNSGGTNALQVLNNSDTASSSANHNVQVAGASAGDATFQATILGQRTWTWGADNSDSDAWVLSLGSALGTANNLRFDSNGGQFKGYGSNTTPPAGFIGEARRSFVGAGSAVTIPLNTPTNITSISLTPGIWNVTCQAQFTDMGAANARVDLSINTTSATIGTDGDNNIRSISQGGVGAILPISVQNYRIELSSTTTVYMVANLTLAGTSTTAYGRISATRVG